MSIPAMSLFQLSMSALSYFSASATYTAHIFPPAASSSWSEAGKGEVYVNSLAKSSAYSVGSNALSVGCPFGVEGGRTAQVICIKHAILIIDTRVCPLSTETARAKANILKLSLRLKPFVPGHREPPRNQCPSFGPATYLPNYWMLLEC
jgi:hypothetical protein